jgi:GNAT superfamily N-acetyltransferase
MRAAIVHECQIERTPRVLQMAGMFDLPLEEKTRTEIDATLPIEDRPWTVGLIVGPSGSGKSSIARHLWPSQIVTEQQWSPAGALLDDFPPSLGVRDVVGLLTAVGLGSPPAWVRPYRTLSNGEAFRASMARAIAEAGDDLVVVDEFTSVVDRQVAMVASHAVQKTVRRSGRQLVAVTCHYDVTDWLQPDWVYDAAADLFSWRSVQPHPQLQLDVYPVDRTPWSMFRRHHYLSGDLHKAATCFGGWIGDQLVAFAAIRHFPHAKTRNIKMGHRLVVLPDYQGLGIGGRLDDWIGQHLWDRNLRYRNVVAHPAMIAYYSRSPRWTETGRTSSLQTAKTATPHLAALALSTRRLGVRSFEYRAPRGKT